jgi:diguanylate cyclase (GGDEF)-like protein
MSSIISEKSFERFAKIVQAIIPDAAGFVLCDDKGQPVHHLDFDSDVELLPAIRQLCDERPDWASHSESQVCKVNGQVLLTTGISDERLEVIATLAVSVAEDTEKSSSDPLISAVAECIEHEIALDKELNSMTYELTERYEELNLVYHTDDQVNHFRQGHEALQNLTQNCLDYLDVDLAMLILKNKGVKISCSNPDVVLANSESVQAHLTEEIYSWIMDSGETVVIDGPSDPQVSTLLSGAPHNVLCCPIFESSGEVAGIMATVNSHDKRVFTNSDRNLIQVMARKASKIVSANYDALTGLMNRNGYEYFLESAIELAKATAAESSVLHINIDRMHFINDSVSHAAGDAVICGVADMLDAEKNDLDVLCRIGGDEFGVLIHKCTYGDAERFAEEVCQRIEESPIEFEGQVYSVTASIGVATISAESDSVAQLVGLAEVACSVAKERGQNRVETYRPDNTGIVRRSKEMDFVAQIHSALAENRFTLYCQPIRPLAPEVNDHHTEILLRLINESGEMLLPGNFIPAAERYFLMPSIDKWVISHSLAMLTETDENTLRGGTFAINLSGQSLCEPNFLDFTHAAIKKSGVPPECICFEITETAAVANLDEAAAFMESLGAIGCTFSLDDFGAGISSFGYLKRLPVDLLKIDGAIVKDIALDDTSAAMVVAINEVGHAMRLRTIAEFAENEATIARLKEIGVDYVQGYAIGRPVPFGDRLRELTGMLEAKAS